MAVSIVLLAHYALGIQVESDAETLGLRFQVPSVEKVWAAIWLVWGWALITYLQHLHELNRDDFPKATFQVAKFNSLRMIDRQRLLKVARTKGLEKREPGNPTKLTLSSGPSSEVGGKLMESYRVEVVWNNNDAGRFVINKDPPVGLRGLVATLWSWLTVLTMTRYGTDYYAPLIVAAAPFVFWLIALGHSLI